jgi:NAD(P)-dependent dehydrogenase (short-subunit alcohol dehydrogenase family)
MRFAGKRALVTGATKGIGRATVARLAREGAAVIATGRDEADLASLRDETGCETLVLDLADADAIRAAVAAMPVVDYLVNNAGIVLLQSFFETTMAAYEQTMAVNVRAPLLLGQAMARQLVAARRPGAIVNVSSTASHLGVPDHTAYCTSKGAVDSLTLAMAVELGPHGIRANAVNPTITMTAMGAMAWSDPAKSDPVKRRIPLGRFAEPEEVAAAISYLLSDDAAMINGVIMRVDGGHLIT